MAEHVQVPTLAPLEPMLIGGSWMTGQPRETIPVIDPATEEVLTTVPQAGDAEVTAAVAAAAQAHADGRWRDLPLAPSARTAREEIFGPVLTVFGFDTDEQALALANDTEYGLAAGVWTTDLSRAHRVAAGLQAGTVWVNTYNEFSPAVAFGGVKQSGLGYDLGDAAVESLTNLKNITVALTAAKSVTP